VLPLVDVAYTGVLALAPTATHRPELLTVTEFISALAELPFIAAGVVHVVPLVDVAYIGAMLYPLPTATHRPDELTATDIICDCELYPFITVGVVQVDPSILVANTPE
jgi:hypothetical protein